MNIVILGAGLMGRLLACGVGSVAVVRALVTADDTERTANSLQASIDAELLALAAKPKR